MNRYGQAITWGAAGAPHLFTGDCLSYGLKDAVTKQEIEDENADLAAVVLHSRKAALSFEAQVNSGTTNFLDLSAGAAITVSTISGGTVLASRTVERWALGHPKTASVSGYWYPDMTSTSPAQAGSAVSAFTPDQTGLSIPIPSSKVIYGTYGLTHAAGIVQGLTLTQILKITEDEPNPDGTIQGATSSGYQRTISLEVLATGTKPAVRSTLVITGAPATAGNFVITSADEKWAKAKGKMYEVEAVWIPAMGS